MWLGHLLITVQYVLYFQFGDDVMLSHNGANRYTYRQLENYSPSLLDSPGVADCLVYVSGCGFMLYRGIAFVRNIC